MQCVCLCVLNLIAAVAAECLFKEIQLENNGLKKIKAGFYGVQ